jgi:hypothetical protein
MSASNRREDQGRPVSSDSPGGGGAAGEAPKYACDLILKGGITSGIVYPPAIVEIARDHRLCSVGGASAGAIGAVAAAAAELGRSSRTGGFDLLATLPATLAETDDAGETRLRRLFQADPSTSRLFDLVWFAREQRGRRLLWGLVSRLRSATRAPGLVTGLGAALLLVAVVLLVVSWLLAGPWSLVASVPFVALASVCWWVVNTAGRVYAGATDLAGQAPGLLADNFHGLCSGRTSEGAGDLALTDWLHETIQALAGRGDPGTADEAKRTPVTYGELRKAGVDLLTVTTNVSQGTNETFPLRDQTWAFRPDDMRRLFPDDVVDHLVGAAPPAVEPERKAALERHGLLMLPEADDLPVLLGARVSLSFPVLLSAVPLYAWAPRSTTDGWEMDFRKCWFSDGGITSNLPVHLFDRPLPTRPTYAINLGGGADPQQPAAKNVWRPVRTGQGQALPVTAIDSTPRFLSAVFDTMQNWSDNSLRRAPGQRDRVCTIRLGTGEGGMNLDMPSDVITGLVQRGAAAGRNLAWIRRGALSDWEPEDPQEAEIFAHQWDRHRFARLRTVLAGVGGYLADTRTGLEHDFSPDRGYLDLARLATRTRWLPYRQRWTDERVAKVEEAAARVFTGDVACFTETAPAGSRLGYTTYAPAADRSRQEPETGAEQR